MKSSGSNNLLIKLCLVIGFTVVASVSALGFMAYTVTKAPSNSSNDSEKLSSVIQGIVEVDTIYNNIYIDDMHMGGLTKEEALLRLKPVATGKQIILTYEDILSYNYAFDDFYTEVDLKKTVEEAFQYARQGTNSQRYEKINNLKESPIKLYTKPSYERDMIMALISEHSEIIDIPAVDATLDRENGKFIITEESIGRELDVEMTAEKILQQLISNESAAITAVVKNTFPTKTVGDMENAKSLIGTFSTKVSGSMSLPRNINILTAADKINDVKLEPQEVFSTNHLFGTMTYENGYRPAATILNGEFVDEFGGGVCQVSSTLYMAVLFAELDIVERQNHSLKVAYMDYAFDATLAGTYIDFKFRNSTEYPLFVEAYVDSQQNVIVNIYGYEEHPPERRLEFKNTHIATIEPEARIVIEDANLPMGEVVVVKAERKGQRYQLHKYIYEGTQLIDKVLVNTSTYRTVQGEERRGTGAVEITTVTETLENFYSVPVVEEDEIVEIGGMNLPAILDQPAVVEVAPAYDSEIINNFFNQEPELADLPVMP